MYVRLDGLRKRLNSYKELGIADPAALKTMFADLKTIAVEAKAFETNGTSDFMTRMERALAQREVRLVSLAREKIDAVKTAAMLKSVRGPAYRKQINRVTEMVIARNKGEDIYRSRTQ